MPTPLEEQQAEQLQILTERLNKAEGALTDLLGRLRTGPPTEQKTNVLGLIRLLEKAVRRRTQALVESEAELLRTNADLQRHIKMKQEFVSIAAHELRTPLTSIVGYLELMKEGRFGRLPKELQRPMLSVHRNAQRLRRLVDEMLDVSRIEAERMVLNKKPCDLAAICTAVIEELHPLAETKDQTIEANTTPLPEVLADEDKIHQVISNLVSNSIRYCPAGGRIQVSTDQALEERYPGPWARLRVRDDGPGIAQEDLEGIFEPFSDIHPAKHHTSKGPNSAGLGLYIARGLVDLHEGIITVESIPGEFTEFTVLLPSG